MQQNVGKARMALSIVLLTKQCQGIIRLIRKNRQEIDLNPIAGYAILIIEKGKARNTRPTHTITLACYNVTAVTIASSGGYFLPLKIV